MANINFPDAPTTGQIFTSGIAAYRWDGVKWVPYPATLVDAPLDGQLYERQSGTWASDPIQVDAPTDGNFYSRRSTAWALNPIQVDAPSDGNIYGRLNLGWANVSSLYGTITYINTGDANTLAAAKTYADGESVPVGGIIMYGGVTPPANFLNCDGTVYNISSYPKLAAILSNVYGGNGTTTFAVPNLSSKFPFGGTPGSSGGAGSVTLTVSNIPPMTFTVPAHTHGASSPAHSHSDTGHAHGASQAVHSHALGSQVLVPSAGGNAQAGAGWAFSTIGTDAQQPTVSVATSFANLAATAVGVSVASAGPWSTNTLGGGSSFSIYPPYTGVNFIIRYQ